MRNWADVYDSSGTRVAQIDEIISVNTNSILDAAGDFSISAAVSQNVVEHLIRDNEVAIYGQEDDEIPLLWMYGVIIKPRIQEASDTITISISGRDLMEELRCYTVGLARTYTAQTVQAIMTDLTSLVAGWTAQVETATAARLQTARFDGTKVLKAILKSTEKLGVHIRTTTSPRVLEVGVFGNTAATPLGQRLVAMKSPSSITPELMRNDAVLLVDSISMTEDGDSLINWAMPMGAGEGSAATTLKYTTYEILNTDNTIYQTGTTPYFPIYRRVNDANIAEYYIDASDGDTLHQDTPSFKDIGPIANSLLAKQYAADALADACIENLKRTRTPNVSYSLSVQKLRVDLQVGDMIRLQHKGVIETRNDARATRPELVYIDVNEDLWIMGIQRNSNGVTTLTVNTIDQHIKDDTDLIVDVLDRSEVNNLAVQTFPFMYQDSSERAIQGNAPATTPYRDATFGLQVPSIMTDVVSVKLRVKTRPLYTTADIGPVSIPSTPYATNIQYSFKVYESTNYPSDISLYIDGVDRTAALGGPWNSGAGNSAVDVELDISSYIIDAAGGLYQDHSLVFKALAKTAELRVSTAHDSEVSSSASSGMVECKILVLGTARAVIGEPV